MRQLTIYGGEVELPRHPKRLTYRQRELLHYLHAHGPTRGARIPTHRNPWGALKRLEALGLATKGFDGRWTA